jgi:hypothetical protein
LDEGCRVCRNDTTGNGDLTKDQLIFGYAGMGILTQMVQIVISQS